MKTLTKFLFGMICAIGLIGQTARAQHQPTLEGQIDSGAFDQGNRAVVVRIQHSKTGGKLIGATLVKREARVRYADEGPILIETFDYARNPIARWKAVDPLVSAHGKDQNDIGRYVIPYSKSLAYVVIHNPSGPWTVDFKPYDLIRQFCSSNPTDFACEEVDFSADIILDDVSPIILAIGGTKTVGATMEFRSAIQDTSSGVGTISPMFVSPNLKFTTTEVTNFSEETVPASYVKRLKVHYTLECLSAGQGRIFPAVGFHPTAGAHVIDRERRNNNANVIIDVDCVP